MARIRSLKIGFFTNEVLCKLSPWHRLLFEGLWVLADREGRLEDRPLRIKAELFPYDKLNVDRLLTDLAEKGFVIRYSADGTAVIAILGFLKHQRPNIREAVSLFPAPSYEKSTTLHVQDEGEWSLGSGLGKGMEKSSAARAEPSVAVLEFPTVGTHGSTWALTETQLADWRGLFPSTDILAEARKALAWVRANPGRRKTAAGMSRFLVGWLSRSVDSGRANVPPRIPTRASQVGKRVPVPDDEPL